MTQKFYNYGRWILLVFAGILFGIVLYDTFSSLFSGDNGSMGKDFICLGAGWISFFTGRYIDKKYKSTKI